jgi:ABC-type transport system substrate-binding protein
VRVRQAASMSIDREGFADVLDNRKAFHDGGIDLSIGYNTVVGAGWGSDWLDPYDEKTFGPSHKYLKFNVAEAKKLLAAAGYANGVEFDFIYNQDNLFGAAYARTRDLYAAMLTEAGLKPRMKGVNYTEYNMNHYGYLKRSTYGNTSGFNGALLIAERPYATVASLLFGIAHRDGVAFHGATPDGKNAGEGDPKVNDAIDKIRQETDRQKQQVMVHDLIRY